MRNIRSASLEAINIVLLSFMNCIVLKEDINKTKKNAHTEVTVPQRNVCHESIKKKFGSGTEDTNIPKLTSSHYQN